MTARLRWAFGVGVGVAALVGAFAHGAVVNAALQSSQGQGIVQRSLAPESRLAAKPKNVCSASVAADGTFQAGVGVVSTGTLGTGEYEVRCKKKVDSSKCVFTASIGEFNDAVAPFGFVSTNLRFADANGVYVVTGDPLTGVRADLSFNLHVTC